MSLDLADLPDDVREAIAPHLAENPETLDAIGVAIAKKRDEAKAARTASGIEATWKECEEAYVGIDDANRTEFQDAKWSKPMSIDGPVTTGRSPPNPGHKSTAFVRLTARYVDAGSAKLSEILLPIDDKAFSFSETPIPELIKAKGDTSQVVHDGMGNVPLMRALKPGEAPPAAAAAPAPAPAPIAAAPIPPAPVSPAAAQGAAPAAAPVPGAAPAAGAVQAVGAAAPPGGAPQAPPQVPLTVKDLAEEAIDIARKAAKAAETRIYDWMVDCQYPAEMRKVIFDSARIGVGVLKAPFPKASRKIAVTKSDGGGVEIQIKDEIKPAAQWKDPWNIFPDQACGENIHLGEFVFERDYLSERQIRDLKKVPGYLGAQIDKVLLEGPGKSAAKSDDDAPSSPSAAARKGRYEVWYYYGALKREEMSCIYAAAGKALDDDAAEKEQVYAIVTLVNDSVIRATINPLDTGSFPYHSVPWQRRAGHWAGLGVAEQVRMPQKTVNAATRAMLNNAGKSAGSQLVVDQGSIRPADGNWIVVPDKIWYTTADGIGKDVRTLFMAIDIPNVTDHMMKIIEYALKLAEESTSIPLITEGKSDDTTPDTFGGMQLQNSNANQLLRAIGSAFDDYITEPVVRQYYEWLLLDPEVPDEEKGEFTINAHGSASLVERYIQDQTIAQMGPLVVNPVYGTDPKKWMKQFLKSKRMDPDLFLYTEEQQAKIDATPPAPPPPVQVAQIQAAVGREKIAAAQGADQRGLQNEQQIAAAAAALDSQRVEAEQHRTLADATIRLHEMETRRQIAMLEYANRNQISLDRAKADLAKTAMTLRTQEKLNAADNAVDLHKHSQRPEKPRRGARPPGQVPGKAGNGRAFEQAPPS